MEGLLGSLNRSDVEGPQTMFDVKSASSTAADPSWNDPLMHTHVAIIYTLACEVVIGPLCYIYSVVLNCAENIISVVSFVRH